ncbi:MULTISPECIES: ABC transporter ATP-binding protein [Clostridium]|uniref:Galactose/methyl galactoside import ATP-binding protein MglA n=3 Tax=Clostridium TaxID=1485 RepID=D8GUV9_CLOLD|nr:MULTISPECIES: ABC transporter ATP-binding protein [Clostridium]ADK16986.1 predicted ABC-type transporter, ATPase component [Clostridium ljungdahlii DSM 13528]AGY76027.1 ABC transporter ATP-binding protein [Clostridium autoethanogenum DSM 10061]ALU36190.1 Monosaccharide-transporting ATPase [Clostridium autoethanogenum DSM 10061]OAA85364.1 Galactose/methyl galactoside import ATP-binding protein MglA [Clostridium ljungdahlii DSM 13528]OVY51752.1 Galactose/methyl galactoside import ATP-binding 
MEKQPIVEMTNISKEFSGIAVNDKISFSLNAGEIHALLGENGAGKSTLMNILTGLYKSDSGEIKINGKNVEFNSPKDAIACGIGMVHQHFKLVRAFTVAENIMLGLRNLKEIYNKKYIEDEIEKSAQEYGLYVNPKAKIWQLTVGEQQKVEIIKALMHGAKILIMDEPTAVLTPKEGESLYKTLGILAKKGKSIIVISHKMREVMKNTNKITVLRDGKSMGTFNTKDVEEKDMAKMMVGGNIAHVSSKKAVLNGKKILELKDVCSEDKSGSVKLRNISFSVHEGEIFGVAGIDDNGQKELAEVISGLTPIKKGNIFLNEANCINESRRKFIDRGISYVPEDRMTVGLVADMNACENMILENYRRMPGYHINWRKVYDNTVNIIEKFHIKIASLNTPVKTMSGGNMQKLLLAREIQSDPNLIVLAYPFRGLDIGASEYIKKLLIDERNKGRAILLISEELEDLIQLSDRICVLHEGSIMGIVDSSEVTMESIGLMMSGSRKENYSD